MNLKDDPVYSSALFWLKLHLTNAEQIEEMLWGNYIEGGLEEHPTQDEVNALVPQVLEALTAEKPLPAMHDDIRHAFAEYLASYDKMIFDSEFANSESEEWGEMIQEAYIDLRKPLTQEIQP